LFFLTTVLFTKEKLYRIAAFIFLLFGTIILFLTLSRVALLVWVVLLLSGLLIRFGKRIGVLVSIGVGLFAILVLSTPFLSGRFLDASSYVESFDLRLLLQQAAISMWMHHPLFGIGLHNFLIALPSFIQGHVLFGFLQPVHNIFLFILAETGLIGLCLFCATLGLAFTNNLRIVRQSPSQISLFVFLSLCAIIAIGFTDHYFLTLQQGQLLFAFILGLSFRHGTIRLWPFIKNLQHTRSTK
jgi:O-antigen ligase